ncbi:MAG: GAF domain-containing protein [Chloroflexi bacterium]|nr:GAF domain-containing protein [Chloroflexota bacterium]
MRNSLRTRLIVFFILVTVFPLLLVGIVLGLRTFRVQQQQALNLQAQIVQRVSTAVEAFFWELESQLRFVVEVRGLQDLSLDQQRGVLSELLTYQDAFNELALLDEAGREQARLSRVQTIGEIDLRDRSQADEFLIPQETGESYFSPVRFDPASAEPLLTLAVPIFDPRSGEISGVLVADARLKRVWDLIADVRVGEGQSVYIVDEQNRVIAHRNPSVVLRETTFAIPGQDGIYPGLSGTDVVLAHDQIEVGGQGFYIVAEQALSQALGLAITTLILLAGLTVVAMAAAGGVAVLLVRQIVQPVENLAATAQSISDGELSRRVEVTQQDEIGRLARAFNTMTTRLRDLIDTLEARVTARTVDLERRSTQLEAAAKVGRAAASILDVNELMDTVVDMIRDQFDLYYVGLFLLDETGEWMVARAGSGAGGQAITERGFRLRVSEGMIGWCVRHAEARIAEVAEEDEVRVTIEELSDTRSEAALPLRSRGEVIGALSVASDQPETFDEALITVLQTMADQVAVAIDNARLFAESQAALEAEQRAYGELSRQAWHELLRARSGWGYRYAQQAIVAAEGDWDVDMRKAAQTGQTIQGASPTGDNGEAVSTLAIPIQQRGQVVGVLSFRKDEPGETWSSEEITVLEDLVEQLGVALESARLYEDTQRRAARERVTGEIAARMRETLDMEAVLETAAGEIGKALDLAALDVRLDL